MAGFGHASIQSFLEGLTPKQRTLMRYLCVGPSRPDKRSTQDTRLSHVYCLPRKTKVLTKDLSQVVLCIVLDSAAGSCQEIVSVSWEGSERQALGPHWCRAPSERHSTVNMKLCSWELLAQKNFNDCELQVFVGKKAVSTLIAK